MAVKLLSIVIPTLNESKSGWLVKILNAYRYLQQCEILCVDGGSTDNTLSVIQQSNARLIATDIRSRSGRLNAGIRESKYGLVLLHHPRSLIDIAGIKRLIHADSDIKWGAFTHKFDLAHPLLTFTSWYSNLIRGDMRGIYYLDHCIFVNKALLTDIGLVPELDIFEDTALCLKLKNKTKGCRLPFICLTSAIRFEVNGVFKQALKNQYLKWQFYFKRPHRDMNKHYEAGLELNSHYPKTKNIKK